MKKRIVSMLLAIVMVVGLIPGMTLTASAANVTSVADLQTAISAGGTVTLGGDIDLGSTVLTFPDNTPVTIDLNGHTLSKSQSGYVLELGTGDNVTIAGSGTVSKAGGWYFFKNDSGCLKIEGGTYSKSGYDLVYMAGSSVTEITGGTFALDNIFARQSSESTGTISNGQFTVKTISTGLWDTGVTITGGTYTLSSTDTPVSGYVDTNVYTITKSGDNTYTVGEKPKTYTITVTASPTEGGTATSGGTYVENASVTVTATPASGYKFVKWTENGSDVSTDAEYTFTAAANRELTAVFKAIEYVTVNLESPRGLKETLEIDTNDTVADLKAAVAAKCNVSFGEGSEYRLFGADLSYPNSKLDDDAKVLKDIGFANDQTIHLEKSTSWDASGNEPIKIFGLTITGGKGSQEPYGDWGNVDYYWNYYYKTITLKNCPSSKNVTISGMAEPGARIIVSGKNIRHTLTLDGVTLNTEGAAGITIGNKCYLDLTLKGTNNLITGPKTEYGVTYNLPAICLNNADSTLKINKNSTGTVTATSTCNGAPGIGADPADADVKVVEIKGGTVIANGGPGAPGFLAPGLNLTGGTLTANGGTGSTTDIVLYKENNSSIKITDGVFKADVFMTNGYGTVNINEGTEASSITAADVYFNVDKDVTVTGNAWHILTDDTNAVTFVNGTDDYRGKIYGKAGVEVTFTIAPKTGYEPASVAMNGKTVNATEGAYNFTMPAKAATITANWTPNTYTVKFDANGGTGAMADQSFTYDVAQDLNANAFTYANKYFTGWKDGNGASYTVGQNVKNLTTENGGTVTLYAQWSDKPAQEITFDTTDRSATYGDGTLEARNATATGTVTYSSSNPDVATVDTNGVVTVLKAGEVTITASAAETDDYAAGSASYKLTISKKKLTITVANTSVYVGSQKPDLSAAASGTDYTISGLVGGDTVTVTLSYATEPDMTKAGEYAITATGTDVSGNYTFDVVDGKLTVSYRPSSGGSSNTTSKTEKNEDGSTTTTTTNKTTGTVTETTKYPDGSTTTVETKKDGSTTETSKTSDGTIGTVATDKDGNVTEVSAKVPAAVVKAATESGEAVKLPVEVEAADDADKAVEIEVDVPTGGAKVDIPVEDVTSGTVVVVVNKDGTEEIVKKSTVTEDGVVVALNEDATLKIVDNSKHFVDVHPVDHWAETAVDFVVARTIYSGTSATTFHPDNPMTRGMLAVVLHNLEDDPDHAFDDVFYDVAEGSWYEDAIHWAADSGIVSGYGNGLYGPNDNITREQLAVMLWRYAGSPDSDHGLAHFKDAHLIASYAETALAWANENGIINGKGDGILDPKGNATRAQVAQMLMNYLQK